MSGEKSDGKNGQEKQNEIEKLRSDMDKAISGIKSEIEELKNALVELKASLSEMENPFNLLASLVDEDGLRKFTGTVQAKASGEDKGESKRTEEKREERKVEEMKQLGGEPSRAFGAGYDTSIALIKWVWTLLDLGFEVDDVEKISKYCEFFSLLPKGSSHYVSAIASAVEKARMLNLSEDIMALSIYGAAKASSIKIELEDITDIVFNALRKLIARPSDNMGLQG